MSPDLSLLYAQQPVQLLLLSCASIRPGSASSFPFSPSTKLSGVSLNLFYYFPLSFLLHTYNPFSIQQNQIIFLQYKLYQLTFLLTTLQWLSIIHLEKNSNSFPDLSNKTFHKSVSCIYISSCLYLLYLYLSSSQNALPLSSSHLLFFIHSKLILI